MVRAQLAARGISDAATLSAFDAVPREAFVPPQLAARAYADEPLPIAAGQTISQPYIVAYMVQALGVGPEDRVLEVGAGSGYAAAILSRIAREVVAVERHAELADSARERLAALGYDNVRVVCADGSLGWQDGAPYDAILVSAGGPEVPAALVGQLALGGRLVMPVGDEDDGQQLVRVTRAGDGAVRREALDSVRFVPLVGKGGWQA